MCRPILCLSFATPTTFLATMASSSYDPGDIFAGMGLPEQKETSPAKRHKPLAQDMTELDQLQLRVMCVTQNQKYRNDAESVTLSRDTIQPVEVANSEDQFLLETRCVRMFSNILDTLKDTEQTKVNIHVTEKGLEMVAHMFAETALIKVILDRHFFCRFELKSQHQNPDVVTTLHVNRLQANIANCLKWNSQSIQLQKGVEPGFTVHGVCSPGLPPITATLSGMEPFQEHDARMDCYNLYTSVNSNRFAQCIDVMGPEFRLSINTQRKMLEFTYENETESCTVGIELDDITMAEVMKCPEARNFRRTYAKKKFAPVVRGKSLKVDLKIAFAEDYPLFLSYTVADNVAQSATEAQGESYVHFWITAMVDENDEV